jgi:hypothetical protein
MVGNAGFHPGCQGCHADVRPQRLPDRGKRMIKLLCKPVRTLVSWLYGVAAGAIVNCGWASAARRQDEAMAAAAPQEWRKAA